MCKYIPIGMILIIVSGCASQIKTFDENMTEVPGIPVNQPVLVEVVKETTYKVAPGIEHQAYTSLCSEKTEDSDYAFLPLGKKYYVGFEAAALGKGEFKIGFNDSGVMNVVSVNSDASAGLDSITGFLEKTLPFFKEPKITAEAADVREDTTAEARSKHCLKMGTKIKGIFAIDIQSGRP